MTYAQVANEARQLTPAEKWDLVVTLLQDLRQTVSAFESLISKRMLTTEDKLRIVDQLGGVLKPQDGAAPSDEQIRDAYTDYLMRKYLEPRP